MKVWQLIEALRSMPGDATVIGYGGYDTEHGPLYEDIVKVEQENVGWDDANDEPIVEVYIL